MTNIEQKAREAFSAEVQRQAKEPCEKKSQKLGLALRRLVCGWVFDDKPHLVSSASPDGVLCYNGLKLTRKGNGVCLMGPSGSLRHEGVSLQDCAARLVNEAIDMVRRTYKARLQAWMAAELAALAATDASFQDSLDEEGFCNPYVNWVIEGSLEPKWWGRKANMPGLTRLILKHAWDHGIFDKEIWGLTIRVCGVRPTLNQYNDIAANVDAVRARVMETPNLAPLLHAKTSGYPQEDVQLNAGATAIAAARDRLFAEGCTPAGWRWLTKQSRQWVYQLHQSCSYEEAVSFINVMAEFQVGRLPTRFVRVQYLLSWVSESWYEGATWKLEEKLNQQEKRRSAGLFMRLATHAVRSRQVKASEVRDRSIEILDFIKDGHPVQKGATWHSLIRRQAEWHRGQHQARIAQLKAERENLPAYEWSPIVSEVQYKEVKAISLTTSDALWEEGDYLEHCVGTYADRCFANKSRIFSMRDEEGTPLATMEVICHQGKWQMQQLRGKRNHSVSSATLKQLAQKVVAAVRSAPKSAITENKVIREGTGRFSRLHRANLARQAIPPEADLIPF